MFKIVTVLVLLPVAAVAQNVLFTDDFNDGNAAGWTELATGAVYEVVDSCYCVSAGSGVQHGSAFSSDQPSGMSVADYSIYLSFTAHEPTHGILLYVRSDLIGETGYFLYLRVYQGQIRICRQDPVGWVQLAQESFTFQMDQPYWVRFMVVGDTLFGRVWQGEFNDQPVDWDITAVDTTYSDPGYFRLGAANVGGQSGFDAEFEDVMVTDQYNAFEATTWAAIKTSFFL